MPVDAHLGELSRELAPPGAAVPPCELVGDHVADVVAVPRVLAAGVAEADDEQVERRGAIPPAPRKAQGYSSAGVSSPPSAAASGASAPASPSAAPSTASSPSTASGST